MQAEKIKTPIDGAESTFADSITKSPAVQQKFENFPAELKNSPRFFPVVCYYNPDKKRWVKVPKNGVHWNDENERKTLDEISGLVGGVVSDYLFADFDHVLKPNGEFVNEKIADYVNSLILTFKDIYIEKSVSGSGLHAFFKPTDGEFQPITNNETGVLYFNEEKTAKLELFYMTQGRWCLLTGDKYEDSGDSIPAGVEVDKFLSGILADIQKQSPSLQDSNKTTFFQENISDYGDPSEYVRDLAIFLLEKIDCKEISNNDSEWLSVISSCKNCGVPDDIIDAWNKTAPEHYNKKGNLNRFNSVKDSNFGIANLIGKAKAAGTITDGDIKKFKAKWYSDNPQFKCEKKSVDSLKKQLHEVTKEIEELEQEKSAAIANLNPAGIQTFDKDFIFTDEIITAAAYAKLYDVKSFKDFKSNIKNQNSKEAFIRDWNNAVNIRAETIKTRFLDLNNRKNNLESQFESSQFLTSGIEKVVGDKNILVCRRPVVISSKQILKNNLSDKEKIVKFVLNYKTTSGKWEVIPAQDGATIFNQRKLSDLALYDLPVTSVNAHLLVDYLDAYKAQNEDNIPMSYVVPRCGWYDFNGEKNFIDPRRNCTISQDNKNISVVVDPKSRLAQSLKSAGSLDEWKKAYELAKLSPVARLTVAASVAPILLNIFGERNFVLYIFGKTRSGKSTSLLLGASAVGKIDMAISFDGTNNGLLGMAIETKDYPFFVDEKQSADKRMKEQFQRFIYSVANGKERARANKDGSIKEVREWQNITICNGETELLDDNATGGAYTRLLQIAAPDTILDAESCRIIREIIKDNYGLAFPLVVDEIFKFGMDSLKETYEKIHKGFSSAYDNILPEYCRYVAVLTLADMFLNMCLGVQDSDALGDAISLMTTDVFELIPTLEEIADTTREKDFVTGFIAAKAAQFVCSPTYNQDSGREVLGKFDDDFIYITVRALQAACDEKGFDYKKIVADLIDAKFFIPDDKINTGRKTPYNFVQKKINRIKANCFRIPANFLGFNYE